MKHPNTRKLTVIATMLISILAAQSSMAQGSAQHSAQASKNGAASVGHSIAGGAKAISGVAAIPFGVVGSIGNVSGQISKDLADAANAPIGEPLPITEDIVSATPSPAQAMQTKTKEIEL